MVYATINGDTVINRSATDTAYIKYGATKFPGYNRALYDKAYTGETGKNHIDLTNLQCGSYYVLRTSNDTFRKRVFTRDAGFSFTNTSAKIDTLLELQ